MSYLLLFKRIRIMVDVRPNTEFFTFVSLDEYLDSIYGMCFEKSFTEKCPNRYNSSIIDKIMQEFIGEESDNKFSKFYYIMPINYSIGKFYNYSSYSLNSNNTKSKIQAYFEFILFVMSTIAI